jgi:hypothetical protein
MDDRRPRPLRELVLRTFVVAFREDASQLVAALEAEGFSCEVVRGPSPAEKPHWSRGTRVLASHNDLWRRISGTPGLTLVCEADFVPVVGFGGLPLPCPPLLADGEARFAWLYSPGSILYGIDASGFTYGHANSAVCYLLSGACASRCMGFFEEEIERVESGEFSVWDSRLGVYLRWKQGVLNYFVLNQYGEHGGFPHTEREPGGVRRWHQAYRLAGRLRFLPLYARESHLRLLAYRIRARARGIARILTGRFFHPGRIDEGQSRWRLARVVLGALFNRRAAERRSIERALGEHQRRNGAPAKG